MGAMNKREKSGKGPWVAYFFAAIFFIAAAVSLLADQNIFLPRNEPSQDGLLEQRFERVMRSEGAKLWKTEAQALRQEVFSYVGSECGKYKYRAASSARLDDFSDEYFGYFKGFEFLFLGLTDFVLSNRDRVQGEIRSMLAEYVFFDLSAFQGTLHLGIEQLVEKRMKLYGEKMLAVLETRFTDEELERLFGESKVKGVSVLASNIHSLGLTGGIYGGTQIGVAVMRLPAAQKLAALINAKIPALSVSGLTAAGTFGISVLVDVLISRVVKYFSEDDLKASLRTAIHGFVDDFEAGVKKAFVASLEEMR